MPGRLFGLEIDTLTSEKIDRLGILITDALIYIRRHPEEDITAASLEKVRKESGEEVGNILEHIFTESYAPRFDDETEHPSISTVLETMEKKKAHEKLSAYISNRAPKWVRFMLYTRGFANSMKLFNATQRDIWINGIVWQEPWIESKKYDPYHPSNRAYTLKIYGLKVGEKVMYPGEPWEFAAITKATESVSGFHYYLRYQNEQKVRPAPHIDLRKQLFDKRAKKGNLIAFRIIGGQILRKRKFAFAPRYLYEAYVYPHIPFDDVFDRMQQWNDVVDIPQICTFITKKKRQCSRRSTPRTDYCRVHYNTIKQRERRKVKALSAKRITDGK